MFKLRDQVVSGIKQGATFKCRGEKVVKVQNKHLFLSFYVKKNLNK